MYICSAVIFFNLLPAAQRFIPLLRISYKLVLIKHVKIVL